MDEKTNLPVGYYDGYLAQDASVDYTDDGTALFMDFPFRVKKPDGSFDEEHFWATARYYFPVNKEDIDNLTEEQTQKIKDRIATLVAAFPEAAIKKADGSFVINPLAVTVDKFGEKPVRINVWQTQEGKIRTSLCKPSKKRETMSAADARAKFAKSRAALSVFGIAIGGTPSGSPTTTASAQKPAQAAVQKPKVDEDVVVDDSDLPF